MYEGLGTTGFAGNHVKSLAQGTLKVMYLATLKEKIMLVTVWWSKK